MDSERLRNASLNTGLALAALIAVALIYALVVRWTGPDPAPLGRARGDLGDIIQVDVRNGCGITGLATRMTDYLRDRGFDVVEQGNHLDFDQSRTVILDRVGNPRAAEALARAVGLGTDRVQEEIRTDYFLDATIVIGADYSAIYPFLDSNTDGALPPCQ